MKWHHLIFSEQRSVRFLRHAIFWISWWIFFIGTSYSWWKINVDNVYSTNPGVEQLGFVKWSLLISIKSSFFLLMHIAATYAFVYFVLPQVLVKREFARITAGTLGIGILLLVTGYFIQSFILPSVDSVFGFSNDLEAKSILWNSMKAGLLNAPKVIALAAIIKLLKRWWIKKKENERLERERIEAEVELLKAQIHPSFLFNSLNHIYTFALQSSPKAPEMLLKLSEILSYMLYDCNKPRVPLHMEIQMIKDYMSLEKIRYGSNLEMNVFIKGNVRNHLIAPLLLFRYIENSFNQIGDNDIEQRWINLEFFLEEDTLCMKLINGKAGDKNFLPYNAEGDLGKSEKRLMLVYPGKYDLKMVEEPEIFLVNLELELEVEPSLSAATIGAMANLAL